MDEKIVKIYWMVNTEICSNMEMESSYSENTPHLSGRKNTIDYIYRLNLFVVNVNVVTIMKINC